MAGANFELLISEEALEQLRALPKDLRKRIGHRISGLETNFAGDVKKLSGTENNYRLRVGDQRVLFRLVGKQIQVYAVKDRKKAYE
ncbi:MAG TPA: type II toxin-antitoxin system RelE/ParE family toxin [Verrucomicrobiae bacterium]|jgi:mRNA interferase RelE/StbE|nr:type II toxin-antitoxin system RelE/ParE family toxin [Verrucomicrobiae bacterium]